MFLHYEWLIKINYLRKNYTFIRNLVHVLYSFFVIVVNLLCDFFTFIVKLIMNQLSVMNKQLMFHINMNIKKWEQIFHKHETSGQFKTFA